MEDLPLGRIVALVPEFAVKDLPLGRTLMMMIMIMICLLLVYYFYIDYAKMYYRFKEFFKGEEILIVKHDFL